MSKKFAFCIIGAGKMGELLINGLIDKDFASSKNILATAKTKRTLEKIESKYKITTSLDNKWAVENSETVILAVKPQALSTVISQTRESLDQSKLIISIVASATTSDIENLIGKKVRVVRAMPNTPCFIGEGMTAIVGGRWAKKEDIGKTEKIFKSFGKTVILDEKYFDAVTALSASGPAYIYVIIESLAEGGVKEGLPRDIATLLAAQTCLGAGKMVIETSRHPAVLKDEVTTPAGCTVDGLLKIEEGGLRVTLIKAVSEATKKAAYLYSKNGKR